MPIKPKSPDSKKLDEIVAAAQRNRASREQDYRARSLKMYPWVCGRCSREFTRENLQELTVHHRDHNHDNNPEDGSNWELFIWTVKALATPMRPVKTVRQSPTIHWQRLAIF